LLIVGCGKIITPGRGKIVLCNVIKQITSQLAGKGYKDSDYTFVIAIMQ